MTNEELQTHRQMRAALLAETNGRVAKCELDVVALEARAKAAEQTLSEYVKTTTIAFGQMDARLMALEIRVEKESHQVTQATDMLGDGVTGLSVRVAKVERELSINQ